MAVIVLIVGTLHPKYAPGAETAAPPDVMGAQV
jgi:hypothetical protein